MSLRLRLWKGAIPAFLVWACAKAQDSDLAGSTPIAGKGGTSTGGTGGKGGKGSGGTAGSSGNGGTVGGTAGRGGTGGSTGGTAGKGSAGAPACGDTTDAGVVLHYFAESTQETANNVAFHLYIENNADEALDLARVAIRYWMTAEPATYNPPVSYYASQAVFLERRAEFVDDGDLSHLLLTFTGEVPAHNADLNGADVEFKFETTGGQLFDQTNDYSFAPIMTKMPHDRITLYVDGKLAWGREPSGLCPGGEGGQGGQGGEGGETPIGAGQGGEGGA
jgi:hypothetical protein